MRKKRRKKKKGPSCRSRMEIVRIGEQSNIRRRRKRKKTLRRRNGQKRETQTVITNISSEGSKDIANL